MTSKKNIPAIYSITNKQNGKIYIGSAVQRFSRWAVHKKGLRNNNHSNRHLQRAWNKYGENSFTFDVIEDVPDKNMLLEREQYWMDHYKSYDDRYGYNIAKIAGSSLGVRFSDAIKKKFSEIRLGLNLHMSDEHKKIMSAVNRHPLSKELKEKRIGEGNSNAKLTNNDVVTIKERLSRGEKITKISKEYNVSYNAIWEIQKGIKWNHI